MAERSEIRRKTCWDIRYVKLHFQCRVTEKCQMPVNKTSALRGGMGEMLLSEHCIYPADRKCADCSFETECLVRRIMYSKFDIRPEFVTTGESIGYVISCEDYRTTLEEGDTLNFGGLLGYGPVMPVKKTSAAVMVSRGGRIPSPIHSLKN